MCGIIVHTDIKERTCMRVRMYVCLRAFQCEPITGENAYNRRLINKETNKEFKHWSANVNCSLH